MNSTRVCTHLYTSVTLGVEYKRETNIALTRLAHRSLVRLLLCSHLPIEDSVCVMVYV